MARIRPSALKVPLKATAQKSNHAGKRARIVSAALKLFASGPYEAVTMDRVAAAAGVAKGTLYLYFPSKEALYLGILSDGLEAIARSYEASVIPGAGVTERLRRAIDASIGFYDGRRDLLYLITAEEPGLARNRLIENWRERGVRSIASLIEEGIRTGLFAPVDSRLATLAILGAIRSVLLYYGTRRKPATVRHELGELVLHCLGKGAANGLGREARR